jgi:hypothetical protein
MLEEWMNKMQVRLNYTGRVHISKSNINISISDDKDDKSFKALFDFSRLKLSKGAQVIVEAYHRMMQSQRYEFGTIEKITVPSDTSLGLLGESDTVKFRVLIIDKDSKILASADGIKIEKKGKRACLLPVEEAPLEFLLWKLQLDGDELVLQLNEQIDEIKNVAAFDPRFIHSVYPAVIREILLYLVVVEDIDLNNPQIDWHINWLKYATRIYRNPPDTPFSDNKDDVLEWIDGVVKAFSDTRKRDWQHPNLKEWIP